MALSQKQLEDHILRIHKRNRRVEEDKAWETSWTRRLSIVLLTYVVVVLFFIVAGLPTPYLNAIVPSVAFLLSTLALDVVKKQWIKHKN